MHYTEEQYYRVASSYFRFPIANFQFASTAHYLVFPIGNRRLEVSTSWLSVVSWCGFLLNCSLPAAYFFTISDYSTTSDTVPAPTVRPPSRIAKRKPFSIAMGAINSISIATLSPGITISTPAGRCATPVTSVVRK